MFTLSSKQHTSEVNDEDDGPISGGFYAQDFESIEHVNLDLDASMPNAVTEQFIDTSNLNSNHVIAPPDHMSRDCEESFVQLAQEQFDAGEKLKFTNGLKAKQHFSLAALYFQRAAQQVTDRVTKQSLIFLADNAETMAFMLEKHAKTSTSTNDHADFSSKKSPHSSPKHSVFDDSLPPLTNTNTSLSESAFNLEKVLNAPHHYDQIYQVLPMSSSMSFFGDFHTSSAPSEDNSRVNLAHSRQRASGVSHVPAADLSMSSSFASSRSGAASAGASRLSAPMRSFLQDLRLLERRLGAIGLMPLTETDAAASLREKEHVISKSALSSSTARLNFLSSRLDESFIVLPSDYSGAGAKQDLTAPPIAHINTRAHRRPPSDDIIQPNPYGNSNKNRNVNNSGGSSANGVPDKTTKSGAEAGPSASLSSSSDQTSYWGAGMGLLQIASKITGMATGEGGGGDGKSKQSRNKSSVLSSSPYGGAAAQQQQSEGGGELLGVLSGSPSAGAQEDDMPPAMQWNEQSTLLPPSTVAASMTAEASSLKDTGEEEGIRGSAGRRRVDSWESVSSSGGGEGGGLEREERGAALSPAAGGGAEGVLRLLSTIERLSEENSRLEKTVETLKSAQHKNSLLTAQIDQFKVEYKLKIDQMKSDILTTASTNSSNNDVNTNSSRVTGSKGVLSADVKDKKLNELERTVNALLRKMTEMKQDSDRKDETIKQYKAKRDKREREKRAREKEKQSSSSSNNGGGPGNDVSGNGSSELRQDKQLSSSSSSSSSSSTRTPPPAPVRIPSSEISGTANSPSASLSSRRGISSKTVSTSTATATATFCAPGEHSNSKSQSGRSATSQSRSRISLTSASPSTATATLRTSLKREISAGRCSPPKPNSSLRKGHQQPRK